MSAYTHCRECGTDLGHNGRGFGMLECCCDDGWCFSCCPGDDDQATSRISTSEGE